jgi:hypothetical protein
MARRRTDGGPTKVDLVRAALDAGIESPKAIVEHIKKQGVEINSGQVSNYKTSIKKEKKTRAKPGPKPGNGRRGPRAKAAAANGTGYADKVSQLKALVQQLGADEVKKLADLLM